MLPGRAARQRQPLRRKSGVARGPPAADRADAVQVWDAHILQEHLVELAVTGHLAQRPHVDPGGTEIDAEIGDPVVFGHVRIGPSQQHGELRLVGKSRPHLLPVHHPLVAVVGRLGWRVTPGRTRRPVR